MSCNTSCSACAGTNACNRCGCSSRCVCGCGCTCDIRPFITLCGVVTGANNILLPGVTVQYTINGVSNTVVTNAAGRYTIRVLRGTIVTIRPLVATGVTVTPAMRTITAGEDRCDLNFQVSGTTANVSVTGNVSGLSNNANVPICYWINGEKGITYTDANGNYTITAPSGASVAIQPAFVRGYFVTPDEYCIRRLSENLTNRNFVYRRLLQGEVED